MILCFRSNDGTPWPPDRFTDDYIAFTRRVTAREIRFHDLRHTHASELLRRGIPLKTVSQRLGHANPTVTLDIYAHVMSGDDEKAAKTTEDIYKKTIKEERNKRGEMNLAFAPHLHGTENCCFGRSTQPS